MAVVNGGTGVSALTGTTSLRNSLGFGTGTGVLAVVNGGTGVAVLRGPNSLSTGLGLGSGFTATSIVDAIMTHNGNPTPGIIPVICLAGAPFAQSTFIGRPATGTGDVVWLTTNQARANLGL